MAVAPSPQSGQRIAVHKTKAILNIQFVKHYFLASCIKQPSVAQEQMRAAIE